jgi:serine/threonine-protein kinase ULK/ATG1
MSGTANLPLPSAGQQQQQNIAGDYAIGEEIGRGSFATVFIGRATSPNKVPQVVAIKAVLREKLNRKLAENLESEIKILKGIKHENIVSLVDIVVGITSCCVMTVKDMWSCHGLHSCHR